jgi:hypothetical protein
MQCEGTQERMEKRYQKNPDFVYRRVADECLLVPVRRQVADLNYIYVLNPVADRIWELIDGQRTVREIQDQVLAEFEANPQEVEQDVQKFMEELAGIGGIEEV